VELEVTWGRAARVWWAFVWRNLIALVVALVIGAAVGFVIGFAMGAAGASQRTIQFVTAPIGAFMGLGISIVPVRMILGKNFGDFRLALVARSASGSSYA
jgi:hypothetical protein